jgi:Glycosyltransferase family 87
MEGMISRHKQRTQLVFGMLLLSVSAIGLAGLQYLMPPSFDNPAAVNQAGIVHFRSVISTGHVTPLSVSAFVWLFRFFLTTVWVGYGTIVWTSYRYNVSNGRFTLPAIGLISLLLALLFPPSLSSDVYAYVGWGRMCVIYGWSPYQHTLRSLAELGDSAGLIAPVGASTTHGPIWIALVCAVVGPLRNAGLWVQVVGLKLLAGGAVLAAAISGREIARFYDPRRSELALLAIGFNPLFLIEGPGNGHNDVLMMALMLGGLALCQHRRQRVGYLLVGLSVGIKFVTAAIVPWLIWQDVLRDPPRERLAAIALALGLVLAPSVVGYTAFRAATGALEGIKTVFAQQTGGIQETELTTNPGPGGNPTIKPTGRRGLLPRLGILLLVYAALSIAVWRSDVPGLYLSCWGLFCVTLIAIGVPVTFAWYMVWPFSASLVRWDKFGLRVTLCCAVLSVILLVRYTVPYAR